jgi:hypothetical protein
MSWQGGLNLAHVRMLEKTFARAVAVPVTYMDGSRGTTMRWEVPAWVRSLAAKVRACEWREELNRAGWNGDPASLEDDIRGRPCLSKGTPNF